MYIKTFLFIANWLSHNSLPRLYSTVNYNMDKIGSSCFPSRLSLRSKTWNWNSLWGLWAFPYYLYPSLHRTEQNWIAQRNSSNLMSEMWNSDSMWFWRHPSHRQHWRSHVFQAFPAPRSDSHSNKEMVTLRQTVLQRSMEGASALLWNE